MDKETVEVTTETHAEKCPVCNGFGTLKYGELTCQGCKGLGWVVVPNKVKEAHNG